MAMVGVVSGSLYRRTHSLSRLDWSWVGGRLAPFYIHQMNRVNSRNGSAIVLGLLLLFLLLLLLVLLLLIERIKIYSLQYVDQVWGPKSRSLNGI